MIHARTDYDRIQDPAGLIAVDEPVFLVRAKDVCAPATIRAWIREAISRGADNAMIESAKRHVERMEDWQREHGRQVPDMPEGAGR